MPPDDQPVPFVSGATYNEPGAAFVYQSAYSVPNIPGDFNRDTVVDAMDVDMLAAAAHSDSDNLLFDLNDDGMATFAVGQPNAEFPSDSDVLIYDILETRYGDADLDGQVFLSDLTRLATNYRQAGQFGWAQGNFNGSQEAGTAASPAAFFSAT